MTGVTVDTGMMASLTGATIKRRFNRLFQETNAFGESIEIGAENQPAATFYFEGMPGGDYLNAPLSLSAITVLLILIGLFFSLKLTSNKDQGSLD